MSNKILILGGNGFLGKNLVRKLSQSFDVVVVDSYTTGCECVSYNLSLVNLNDIYTVIDKEKPDVLINLVSSIGPGSTEEDYIKDHKMVYEPCEELLNKLNNDSIKYIYFSSGGAVYGNGEGCVNEDSDLNPISYYGKSKKDMEIQTKRFASAGLKYLIIRPSNPYGHGQNIHGRQGIIANTIGKIKDGTDIEIWGDGENRKDYIYIDDFVEYIDLLIKKDEWNQVYNIGSGVTTSVNEIMDIFKNTCDVMPEIRYTPFHSDDVKNVYLDCRKIQSVFDVKCKTIAEGISIFLNEEL